MRLDLSIAVSQVGAQAITVEHLDGRLELSPAAAVIPQLSFNSAPALEVRDLGGGKRIAQDQALAEVAALGAGWRLETRQELYALVDLEHKNHNGAYTRDESLHPEPYWTADKHPSDPSARVVVWFGDGYVISFCDDGRARARAVRVAGQ